MLGTIVRKPELVCSIETSSKDFPELVGRMHLRSPRKVIYVESHSNLRRRGHGFCVGRSKISLTNDRGVCVVSMATACATSLG